MLGKFKKMLSKKEEPEATTQSTSEETPEDSIEEVEEIEEVEDQPLEESLPIELNEVEEGELPETSAEEVSIAEKLPIDESLRRSSRQAVEEAMRANNEAIGAKKADKLEQALAKYSQSITLCPGYSVAYYNRALLHNESDNIDDALADYTKAIEIEQDPEYYNNRGNVYLKKNEFAKAREDYDKSLALSPNYAEAYHNRGQLNILEEKWQEALQDLTRAVQLNSGLVSDYFNLACICTHLGFFEQALEWLEQAYNEGYTNYEKVANDVDLSPLHQHPAFQDLLERWQYPKNTLALKMTRSTSAISLHHKHRSESFTP